ncbi:MAG TPA: hypothetical protein VFV20_03030 [Candidatus Limnocylindria bacterium]|nr:hypothetical protein [Candidatus Limnocylindria bacterium]
MATLLGRRFGQQIAGWLIAFPWTSAPVSFFLALDHGPEFAATAAKGSVAIAVGEVAFAVGYSRVKRGWLLSLLAGSVGYVLAGVAFGFVDLPVLPLALVVGVLVILGGRLLPPPAPTTRVAHVVPRWDLPARVLLTTALVLGITLVAPRLGAYGSAIVASFPLYGCVLAVFAERHGRHADAVDVMRGMVSGLFGYMSFFIVIALALVPLGTVLAFALAVLTVLVVQGITLAALHGRAPWQ